MIKWFIKGLKKWENFAKTRSNTTIYTMGAVGIIGSSFYKYYFNEIIRFVVYNNIPFLFLAILILLLIFSVSTAGLGLFLKSKLNFEVEDEYIKVINDRMAKEIAWSTNLVTYMILFYFLFRENLQVEQVIGLLFYCHTLTLILSAVRRYHLISKPR
jgi:hypothetical protein